MTTQQLQQIPRGSREYLRATVTADVTLDETIPVALALTSVGTHDHTWLTAEWDDQPATTRVARTTSPVDFEAGTYGVYVRLTDNPEAPILHAYSITVT